MPSGRRDEYEEEAEKDYDEALEEEKEEDGYGAKSGGRKRSRSEFIDEAAEEDDEYVEEEEEDDDDDDYAGGGGRKRGGGANHRPKKRSGSEFFDLEAQVDSDEEEDDDAEDDLIVHPDADLPDEDDGRRMHRRPLLSREEDDQEDVEAFEKRIQEKYASRSSHQEYDEETTEVEQQALLPSVRDPKLWMVKCAIGHEREVAVRLMQKFLDKGSELQIQSAIALDHVKNYIYIEADKEAHVKEACKGMHNIYTSSKILLVPIKEMTDVLSVGSKAIDLSRDTWVRMKNGTYKGDLAKMVDVDNVRQRVTVKLIPRIDLQALANKSEGREVPKKKAFTPAPRLLNVDEARDLHLRVERKRNPISGDYFEKINKMLFKDGFYDKKVSMKSVSTQNIHPSFDELEKFRPPSENGDGEIASLSSLFANRKKGHFMKGNRVRIVKGDIRNIQGWVEKVEEDTVHIKPNAPGLLEKEALSVSEKALCKYFEPGNHVKVVSGAAEGATGMVLKVQGHVVNIMSDTTKEVGNNIVESSEVTSGITRIGDYKLHDLVQLDNSYFGVIIRVESEACQVLKGSADRAEVVLVRLRDIKCKIDRKHSAPDCMKNTISAKDVVEVLDGPRKDTMLPRVAQLRAPNRVPQSPGRSPRGPPLSDGGRHRGGRGHDNLIDASIKVRMGPFKGYKGRVVDVKGTSIRVELESQMKVVTVDRAHISDNVNVSTPCCDNHRYGSGSETPMHPSRTLLHPYTTPMRDPGATPIHDCMRTPMHDRAWNPYAPMSPPRDSWEDGNPGSWGTSLPYQPGSPPSRAYEAHTPCSGWANTPSGNYSVAGTPRDSSPAYANAPSPYLPSTQPNLFKSTSTRLQLVS